MIDTTDTTDADTVEPAGPDATDATDVAATDALPRWRRIEPMHVLVVLVVLVALALVSGPLSDLDVYWHVLIGREILATHHVSGLGTSWSLNLTGTHWTTTQWLSEVILAKTQGWFGWRGVIVLRELLALLLAVLLARQLLRRAVPRVAAPILAVTLIIVASTVQERPALATLLFAVWLGGVATDLLLDGRRPSLWLTFGLVVLWANLHGGWVIAPFALGAVALACGVDGRAAWPKARTALLVAAVTVVAGCATPIGLAGLAAPFRFAGAAKIISEWQPTPVLSSYCIPIAGLVGTLVVVWARGRVRPPLAELVYTAVVVAFAFQALRNVSPAALLLAPLAAERVMRSYHPRRARVHRREAVVLWAVAGALCVVGAVIVTTTLATINPLRNTRPLAIARTLAATPGEKRVLNAYNSSGVLAQFGGPGVRLAVDGRADRYGNAFLTRYTDAFDLEGDWQGVLRQVDPDYAVLKSSEPLTAELRREGWTLVQTDGQYVLLTDVR